MHDRDRCPLTVLMTADAVGGVWHYALALCAALPEIRFVLAVMGPMPSAAQRDAAGRLDNVVLEEYAAIGWNGCRARPAIWMRADTG